MIELLNESKCVQCNLCVDICPTRVFDSVARGIPVIARKSDCQTCFMCELYCPVDAMYVAPEADESVALDYDQLVEVGLIGSYKAEIGWGRGRKRDKTDASYHMLKLYFETK